MSAPSINLAGKPERVGGAFASATGALVLMIGLPIAIGVWMLLSFVWTLGVGLAVALPIALIAVGIGVALLGSGKKLTRAGSDVARQTREQAVVAAAIQRGAVTAIDASRLLGVSPSEADAIMTALAKREPDRLSVDVDDQGVVWFRAAAAIAEPRVRVEDDLRPRWSDEKGAEGEGNDLPETSDEAATYAPKGRR